MSILSTPGRLSNKQKLLFPGLRGLPISEYGVPDGSLRIVGLHGARPGSRPFSDEVSGAPLFTILSKYGFANQVNFRSENDNMRLINCKIANPVKRMPPKNRPNGNEMRPCNTCLQVEVAGSRIRALGAIAHNSALKALDLQQSPIGFTPLTEHRLSQQLRLIDSRHRSRYNFNSGHLRRFSRGPGKY